MAGTDKNADAARRRAAMVAIAWFVRRRGADKTPEDERRFRDWLAEDESHEAVYAQIESVWDTAGDLESLPGLQVMRQQALRPRTGFLGRAGRRAGRGGLAPKTAGGARVRAVRNVAAAAAVAVMVTAAGLGLGPLISGDGVSEQTYQTAGGQRSDYTLPDDSKVTLASGSRIKVRYSDSERLVILSRGEAYFSVAHDPARPFRVRAGSGTVTALGTQFDVYKKNGEVVVVLVDGSVEVEALKMPKAGPRMRRLASGEQIAYDRAGLSDVQEVNAERAVSWRKGRIYVVDKPLLDVIDDMNRHSGRKLRVDRSDPRLKRLLVTGQFKTGRPELLVQYMRAAGHDVTAIRDGHGNVTARLRGAGSLN
ncbi:MAG: FecR family protein [Alphaproteobacteria bacterium]